MENLNQKQNTIYLSKIFKVMFHRKLLLLAITGSITLIGTGFLSLRGKGQEKYVSTFIYDIPSLVDNKYIDGSSFSFQKLVTKSSMEKIKNENEEYKSINLDKLYNSSLFEIKKVTEYNSVTKEPSAAYYYLSMPKTAFKSRIQAENFFYDIINQPVLYTFEAVNQMNYTKNFKNFDVAITLEQQIEYLENQYNLLNSKYEQLIIKYGDTYAINGLISDSKNNLNVYFKKNIIQDLKHEVKQNGYIKSLEETEALNIEKKNLQEKIKYNEYKIDDLKNMIDYLLSSSTSPTSLELDSYNKAITELIIENVNLQERIDEIDKKLSSMTFAPQDFINKLSTIKTALQDFTTEYTNVEKEIVTNNSTVLFKKQKIIEESNSNSTIKNGIFSLAAGILIGCIVNLIADRKYIFLDYPERKKKEEKQDN